MLRNLTFILLSTSLLFSCSSEADTCSCWEELVTRAENQDISSSCEYILDMSLEEIQAEVGPECVDKIGRMLFGDDDIEFEEELDENAMYEEIDRLD
jgi:hypothetical protein